MTDPARIVAEPVLAAPPRPMAVESLVLVRVLPAA
jgi:hypothetical protein